MQAKNLSMHRFVASLPSQTPNAKQWLCLCSALRFFNLTLLVENPSSLASVIFQGPKNIIFNRSNNQLDSEKDMINKLVSPQYE